MRIPAVRTWCEWKKNPELQVIRNPSVLSVFRVNSPIHHPVDDGIDRRAKAAFERGPEVLHDGRMILLCSPSRMPFSDRGLDALHELVEVRLRGNERLIARTALHVLAHLRQLVAKLDRRLFALVQVRQHRFLELPHPVQRFRRLAVIRDVLVCGLQIRVFRRLRHKSSNFRGLLEDALALVRIHRLDSCSGLSVARSRGRRRLPRWAGVRPDGGHTATSSRPIYPASRGCATCGGASATDGDDEAIDAGEVPANGDVHELVPGEKRGHPPRLIRRQLEEQGTAGCQVIGRTAQDLANHIESIRAAGERHDGIVIPARPAAGPGCPHRTRTEDSTR